MGTEEGLFEPDAKLSGLPELRDLDELVRFVREHSDILLRYSKGPKADAEHGPSRDYEAGVELPGLSATWVEPESWWPRAVEDWVARRVCKYAELGEAEGRYPWLLTGEVAGYGPDHEPLLVRVRPLAKISAEALEQAKDHYVRTFDVGKDST
ncbi:DUF6098 family protein [Kribbella sp. HUAS MG21]|uniref:DUF6098 family protein n=1 Tax=Kribbella sp. HUAS MG21 TaxID=3160966 RepID=A0AAU7TGK1_9ACTN